MNTGRFITTALAATILAIPAMADAPGYFKVPGTDTTLKIYGQIQLREGYGFDGNGMGDVSGIPAAPYTTNATTGVQTPKAIGALAHSNDWNERGQWSGSWRYYMGVTTTTPSALGDVTTKVYGRFNHTQGDINGQGVKFNLEQGYVAIGGLEVGTDWSLFGYGAWEPNTLFGCITDEDGNWSNYRQIRYVFSPAKGLDLGFGLETAQSSDAAGNSNATHPSVVAVAAFSGDWGGVTFAADYQKKKDWAHTDVLGTTPVYTVHNPSGNGFSWFLSGGWNITSNDQLTAMILKAGDGVGSGQDGFYAKEVGWDINPTGGAAIANGGTSYSFYRSLAYNVSYTHTWNDQFSSAVTVGQAKWPKNLEAGHYDDFKATEFVVNTTWNMTKTVSLGVEFQHAYLKASSTKPWIDENYSTTDTNKQNLLRFKLLAKLW